MGTETPVKPTPAKNTAKAKASKPVRIVSSRLKAVETKNETVSKHADMALGLMGEMLKGKDPDRSEVVATLGELHADYKRAVEVIHDTPKRLAAVRAEVDRAMGML